MKDFIKWLGVNEKIAKLVVWIMIILIFLIIINTALESLGFPNYKITYDNIKMINVKLVFSLVITWCITILDFYAIVLLVFRAKESKRIFKYAFLYLILNIIVAWGPIHQYIQIFIFVYILMFCYLYSGKKIKYVLYTFLAFFITTIVQGIWYFSKVKFIDYSNLNFVTQCVLSLDYFIIMVIIILVKEIYLNKRSEKLCGAEKAIQDAGYGSETSKKKEKSQPHITPNHQDFLIWKEKN